jgi:hypothetical protein
MWGLLLFVILIVLCVGLLEWLFPASHVQRVNRPERKAEAEALPASRDSQKGPNPQPSASVDAKRDGIAKSRGAGA